MLGLRLSSEMVPIQNRDRLTKVDVYFNLRFP